MKKNIFEVNKEEKRRILEMHINATLRNYLMEELDYQYRPTQDWAKIANLLISYGASCYIQEDNLGKRTKTSSGTKLYREGQTKPTYCELAIKNLEDKSNDPNYRQYSTYNNKIYFSQQGYYEKTVRGYNGGSGYYILSKDQKNLIDRDSKTELLDATIGATSKCPFTSPEDIKGFRNWLNSTYPDVATKFDVDKDRTDCTPQAINAMYYIKDGVEPLWKVYQKNEKTRLDNMQKQVQAQKKSKEEYDKQFSSEVEDSKSYANPDSTQVYDKSGKALGYSHEQKMDIVLREPINYDIDIIINAISLLVEIIPEVGTAISLGIDFIHAMSYFARAFFVEEYSKQWWYYIMMGWIQGTVGLVPAVGNIQMMTVQKLGEKMLAGTFTKILEKFGGTFGIAMIKNIDTIAWAYKLIKTVYKGTSTPQSIGMIIVNMTNKIAEWRDYCSGNKYVPYYFEKVLQDVYEVFAGSLSMSDAQWSQVDEAVHDL